MSEVKIKEYRVNRINLQVTETEKKRIKEAAQHKNMSVNEFIRYVMDSYIDNDDI